MCGWVGGSLGGCVRGHGRVCLCMYMCMCVCVCSVYMCGVSALLSSDSPSSLLELLELELLLLPSVDV